MPYPLEIDASESSAQRRTRFAESLFRHAIRQTQDIETWRYSQGDLHAADPAFDDQSWPIVRVGQTWGDVGVTGWFRCCIEVPDHWDSCATALQIDVGGEALLYLQGEPFHGLDPNHKLVWLKPGMVQQRRLFVAIEAYAGGSDPFWYGPHAGQISGVQLFSCAQLWHIDPLRWELCHDVSVALERLGTMTDGPSAQAGDATLCQALDQMISMPLDELLGDPHKIRQAQQQLQTDNHPTRSNRIVALGHSHIDLAYLWPIRETIRKASRTFCTALRLLERYPEFRFSQSMPQLYQWVKDHWPTIYAQIRTQVKAGRWEPVGAMWVEPDCNLPSGESLIRQILYGQKFWREEFGLSSEVAFLPDVFGFSAALPQILADCGITMLISAKLNSNDTQPFPHTFCRWRGIDGSEVIFHHLPVYYIHLMTADDLKKAWSAHQQSEKIPDMMYLYGYSDGGGGVTDSMVETAKRTENLALPAQVKLSSARQFLNTWKKNEYAQRDLPVHEGELYFENHRGTYTTAGKLKRFNRQLEDQLAQAEWLSAWAYVAQGQPVGEGLERAWKLVLLNQFHDILPGSHISQVYQDAVETYQAAQTLIDQQVQAASHVVLGVSDAKSNQRKQWLTAFNSLAWPRQTTIVLDKPIDSPGAVVNQEGQALPYQEVVQPDGRRQGMVLTDAIPALDYKQYRLVPEPQKQAPTPAPLQADHRSMANRWLDIRFNEQGQLIEVLDKKTQRQVLAPNSVGNALQLFVDEPGPRDAWDIVSDYENQPLPAPQCLDMSLVESGPIRATIRCQWQIGQSRLVQDTRLYAHQPWVEFDTYVEWHERKTLLKAAFTLNVQAQRVWSNIQFGALDRPVRPSHGPDHAKFENWCHRWISLGEGDYGVSLLNDSKYGFDARQDMLRLTLLRCPTNPDPQADQGSHHFRYWLYPHEGDWRSAQTPSMSYEAGIPPVTFFADQANSSIQLPFEIVGNTRQAIVETIKVAEDGQGLIVRLYESMGSKTTIQIRRRDSKYNLYYCNMLEKTSKPLTCLGDTFAIELAPYQVVTLRISPSPK